MENELITKQISVEDLSVNTGSREVTAVISTDTVDRDNEVVLPKGLVKQQYNGNPVVMVNHNYDKLPIGTARWVKADGNKVIARYFVSDKTELARDVFGLLQDGILRGHSIGARVLESSAPTEKEKALRPDWKDATNVWRKWELMEFSVCNIPCNPEALAIAVSKGLSPETVAFLGDEFVTKGNCWEYDEKALVPERTEAEYEKTLYLAKQIEAMKLDYKVVMDILRGKA